MKKGNQRSIRRERIIMVTSSVFVLGALTLTGVYMRNQTKQSQDDGYTIDFTALEERADEKLKEIAENARQTQESQVAEVPDEDLDYSPMEAGSDEVKIPGLTESHPVDESNSPGMSEGAGEKPSTAAPGKNTKQEKTPVQEAPAKPVTPAQEETLPLQAAVSESPILSEELHFVAETMVRPVSGDVLINYSMNSSVYFPTLDQYKYNPAVIYSAAQGEPVSACTAGRVIHVYDDAQLGHVVVLDLGDGYQAVYGQLENIEVPIGGLVEAGAKLATVAAPTKYYSVEGTNLYFQIKKDGVSVDPGSFF